MSSLIKLTRTIHFLEQFIIIECMYVLMYVYKYNLIMYDRIRWCSCRVENILTLGKLLRLWFCFLLHSIFSQTSYRTYKIISSYELARPIMGTIFLVNMDVRIRIQTCEGPLYCSKLIYCVTRIYITEKPFTSK